MTSPPTSPSFWTEAIEVEKKAVKPKKTVRYVISPDTSEIDPASDVGPANVTRDAASGYIVSPDGSDVKSPTENKGDFSEDPFGPVATSLTFFPGRHGLAGDKSYLDAPEYAPNAFGDIADYMRKKDIKVQTQNAFIAGTAAKDLPQIFKGLAFYINGNTQPSRGELKTMILQRGGVVREYLRAKRSVDYIVAPVLTLAKFREFANYKVAREPWIVESCTAGKLLDWRRWRLAPEQGGKIEGFLKRPLEDEETLDSTLDAIVESAKSPKLAPAAGSQDPFASPFLSQRVASQPVPSQGQRSPAAPNVARPGSPGPPTSTQATLGKASSPPQPRAAVTGSLLPPVPTNRTYSPSQPHAARPGSLLPPVPTQRLSGSSQPRTSTPTSALPPPVDRPRPAAPVAPHESTPPPAHDDDSMDVDDNFFDNGVKDAPETVPEDPAPEAPRPEGVWEHYHPHKSNHQAARLMKSDAFRANHTSERGNEAGFIDQFYQNSRLHLLSTWKAALRVLVAEAQTKAVRVPTVLAPGAERVYLHVDFDAFFVSAGLVSRPHLKGRCVVVCHSAGGGRESTSEIASASYEARAKGVRNGMSLGRARTLCGDDLETIPYDFDLYKQFSLAFYTVLQSYADELEAVSIDEALLDVTGAVTARAMAPDESGVQSTDPAAQLANKIRDDIRQATGCEVSIGISHNILLARLATRRAKPAGVFRLTAELAPEFLAALDVDQLPSVGGSTKRKLREAFGTTLCGELLPQSRESLRRVLGPKTGDTLHGFFRGKDDRRLDPDKERKSVSAEMNYGIRFRNQDQAELYLGDLAAEVSKRLRAINARGRHMTLKIMTRHPDAPVEPPKFMGHGKCETINKSTSISGRGGTAVDEPEILGSEAIKLLQAMDLDPVELRGVGIMVTKLDTGTGPTLDKGQSRLSFAAKATMAAEPEREAEPGAISWPVSPVLHAQAPSAPVIPSSSDRVDPEFLAALPSDLRAEIEEDLASRNASKRLARQPSEELPENALEERRGSTLNPAAFITRQLRPKHKTQLDARAIAAGPLYGAWARAEEHNAAGPSRRSLSRDPASRSGSASADDDIELVDPPPGPLVAGIRLSELTALDIDPEVFAALPEDMQKEAVEEQRQRLGIRNKLWRAGGGRSANTSMSPSRHAGKSRNSRADAEAKKRAREAAEYANAPVARIPRRPKLFNARGTDDVARVLGLWVENGCPKEGDVAKVTKYVEQCIGVGMSWVDHLSTLLRSLRGSIRETCGREEDVQEDEAEEKLRKAWWGTFDATFALVSNAVEEHLGAPLRL